MFDRHHHRYDDVNLVMAALGETPERLQVLLALGSALRAELAAALREIIATRAWQDDWHVRATAERWRQEPRFDTFWDRGFEKRRDRGPKREHLDAALMTYPETRAALYRSWAAHSPQHCRSESAGFSQERHIEDYRQALNGWYAAIQHVHESVVAAARWCRQQNGEAASSGVHFTDLLVTERNPYHRVGEYVSHEKQGALREILLMMYAWSPHTFEAIDVAFRKADGEGAFHAWGGGFEPAGRPEAEAASAALATVLTPEERQDVGDLIREIEAEDAWDRDSSLAKLSNLPCTSDRHRIYRGDESIERDACAKARARVHQETDRPWDEGADREASAARLAELLLGPRKTRVRAALGFARAEVDRETAQGTPQLWHDNADVLRAAREAAGLDVQEVADFLNIKPATLDRFEQGTGRLPGVPVSLGYLQLLALTSAQDGRSVPECIPEGISRPATSLPTTP